nr:type II secretion system F family protein [Pararhodobacter sp. SW119]
MAVLLNTGLTADSALHAIQAGAGSSTIEALATKACAGVIEGEPLSQALKHAGAVLPPWYTAALQAGESSGKLDPVFQTLAEHLENSVSDRTAIISALIYPAFVSVVAILVCVILVVTVTPEIAAMFDSAGQQLPALTLWVLGVTEFVRTQFYWLILGVTAILGSVIALSRQKRLRNWRDDIVLRLPLIGRLMRMAASVQYLRTLALVINSRLPIIEALRYSAEVLSIHSFRQEAFDAADALRRGEKLSSALLLLSFLQPVSRQLIQAGEDSARLGAMSDRAAVLAETWLRTERKRLITVLEPASMIAVGGVVLIIVLAILLPIFDMQTMVSS